MVWLSLLTGLAAWTFAMLANARKSTRWMFTSFTTCLIAAVLPLYETRGRLYGGDYAGAEDTIGGILFGEIVLVTVTILINAIALYRMQRTE